MADARVCDEWFGNLADKTGRGALVQNFNTRASVFCYSSSLMQPARLDIERQAAANGGLLVTRLSGKLSLETVQDFISTLRPEPATHLVLDMSALSFLDSAGVGALVSLFVSRRSHGRTLTLAGLTQQGNAVMQVAGLLRLMPIFSSVEQAVAQHA
jgi:anti-sigma B factor antagonist